jgi:DNA-binding CsgD family transcriptional regulator
VDASGAARLDARLLERDSELALIEKGVSAALEGRGSVLLIEGPAGIGKTELLAAARRRAVEAGMEALLARGGELEQGIGLGICRQLFEERLAGASASERRRLLAGAASLAKPALGSRSATGAPGPAAVQLGDPAASMQHGLYWLCSNLAEQAPLLLCVDDLHWTDLASARWLLYLARRLEDLRALVVATVRPGEPGLDPSLPAALAAEAVTMVLRPETLSEQASAELVRERLGLEAEPEFCIACHRVTGGNPFLVGELVEAVRQDGIAPTTKSVRTIEELAPETISRATLLRLARMPSGADPLARSVAILGSETEPRHAAALAELDAQTAADAADALRAASILATGRPLRFVHPLLRTAVYDQIPEAERALAHARAAKLLADDGSPPEQVAAQLLHAEPADQEWIVEALRGTAAEAMARGAPDTAVRYLRRALMEPPPAAIRTDLLRELLDAGVRAADMSALEGISADPVSELSGDPASFMASVPVLGPWIALSAPLEEAIAMGERALTLATEAGNFALAIQVEMVLLSVVQVMPGEAMARLKRYEARIEPGTPEERACLAMSAWWQHFLGGPASEGANLARRALADGRLLEEQAETPLVGQVILVLIRADELDEAEHWIERVFGHAQERGSTTSFLGAGGPVVQLAYYRGDVAAAAEEGRIRLEMSREHGLTIVLPLYTAWLVDALIERDELDEAEDQIRKSGLAGELPDHYWATPVRFSRAGMRLAQGRTKEALDDLHALLRFTDDTWPAIYPIASTIAVASMEHDPKEARSLADWEMQKAREWDTPRAIGVALRGLGLVEGGERGIELLREAVAVLASSPARLEHARALTDLGAALRRANRRSDARDPLRNALEMAHRRGAIAIEKRAREELAATGAKPRRLVLSGVESLTSSELRVARMAAAGMQNREIAQALFVTVKTVETHLTHIYQKLDLSSRKELPRTLSGPDG